MTRARSDMDGTADIEDRIVARLTHCPDVRNVGRVVSARASVCVVEMCDAGLS